MANWFAMVQRRWCRRNGESKRKTDAAGCCVMGDSVTGGGRYRGRRGMESEGGSSFESALGGLGLGLGPGLEQTLKHLDIASPHSLKQDLLISSWRNNVSFTLPNPAHLVKQVKIAWAHSTRHSTPGPCTLLLVLFLAIATSFAAAPLVANMHTNKKAHKRL
ncbi:hypothetical protein ACFE04_020075 [Oxalis oulophora]